MSTRIRHHINPFQCRVALTQKDWAAKHAAHGGPIFLDLGCGKAEFVAQLAKTFPNNFYVGIELRKRVADCYFESYSNLPNLVLLVGNVNLSLPSMFQDCKVEQVYINFPDPYSKKRSHFKRRMVTSELVEMLEKLLSVNGKIFLQTDDEILFRHMHTLFLEKFICLTDPENPETVENSSGAVTDWETACIKKRRPVYRAVYQCSGCSREN